MDQYELLNKYNQLDDRGKKIVDACVNFNYKVVLHEKELIRKKIDNTFISFLNNLEIERRDKK